MKENLPDAEAYVYVIETNPMQRSFTDLSTSEKAAVLAERYDKVMSQRKRNDILQELVVLEGTETTCGQFDHKLIKSWDGFGEECGPYGSSVARLLRVNELIPETKESVDAGSIPLSAAVHLSYMPEKGQKLAMEASKKSGVAISIEVASRVRKAPMTEKGIRKAVAGPDPEINPLTGEPVRPEEKPKPIKLSAGFGEKYFSDTDPKEIEGIIEKALIAWFKKRR